MTIYATLRYLTEKPVIITTQEEVRPGCTAGEFSRALILAEEKKEKFVFSGASIVALVNGRVVTPDHVLEDGDSVTIMPVAAAG